MKRLFIFWVILLPALTQHVHAQYYSVNYDARTVAAMAAAFGTEVVAESYYREQVDDILKHYTAAEVAAAGIFSSKFLEHKALSDLGIWCSSTENYYYRRIYHMVAEKIMPKIWVVAKLMLRSPQTAIHWGSYLMKVCDDTKSLCMQFESVVTNSTLTFSDIAFLEIDHDIARQHLVWRTSVTLYCKAVRSMTCWAAKPMKSATCMNTTVLSSSRRNMTSVVC